MNFNVIKDEDLFLVTEKSGDIASDDFGLYVKDTRFLSKMNLTINGEKPPLLSSVNQPSYIGTFYLMKEEHDVGTLDIKRERLIYDGVLYEKISVVNYFLHEQKIALQMSFRADFQDMFIVRKYREGVGGKLRDIVRKKNRLIFGYDGSDGVRRETIVRWDVAADAVTNAGDVCFSVSLGPNETKEIVFTVTPGLVENVIPYEQAQEKSHEKYAKWRDGIVHVETDHIQFNELMRQSVEDVGMLMTNIDYGVVPVAGLPWYAVPFGRDSLITSLFMLTVNPRLVKGTLRTMAAYQGQEENKWRDEQPGKIMHEIRFGELANTGQIPFTPYYGSVDSTPLFLMVIAEYFHMTGDVAFVEELLPNIEQALVWMDKNSDPETGFLTYHQEAEKGFPNQGWKDSANSIIHQNGVYAKSPIALIEVQGYMYHAKKMLAPILRLVGEEVVARELEHEAEVLKEDVERYFWLEDEQFYAIALDKNHQPVRSVTSNVGHLLLVGLLDREKIAGIVDRLFSDEFFTGYGIRTMSSSSVGFNPQSYHNGSVWPHDNGLILLGLNRSGCGAEVAKLIGGLLKASDHFENRRLPELFCGYSSDVGQPIAYPTTCSPQAWAAASVFTFLHGMLGLQVDGVDREVSFAPVLPDGMNELKVAGLVVGDGHVDVNIARTGASQYRVHMGKNTTGYVITKGGH